MIVLIAGASHVGKTLLAQGMLEKYGYPYFSIDHLKMGLIRSGYTDLTPEDVLDVIAHTSHMPADAPSSEKNNVYGYGEIDAYRGLLYILGIDGIDEISANHTKATISVSGGRLQVRLPQEASKPASLRIFNLSGRQVYQTVLPAHQLNDAVGGALGGHAHDAVAVQGRIAGHADDHLVIDGHDAQFGVELAIHYYTSFSGKRNRGRYR